MIKQLAVKKIVHVGLPVLVLLVLLLTGVRLLLTNTFVQFEYNLPNFPEDPYGMTKEERQTYAQIALEYLLNGADRSFLGELKFDDGNQMFNERELRHMVDVQMLTETFLKIWYTALGLVAGICIWAWRGSWLDEFRRMISRGGIFTLIVLGTLIFVLLLSFDVVFVGFHRIFFEGDSWLFLFSDTLIRLFPLRFWQDAFILVGAFAFTGGLILWLALREKPGEGKKKSTKA
jgi:integral membrane protein (TIGR01906 family)